MKKNAMLKIAAVLLVAVLLTTCAISSTFAKYVATGEAQSQKAQVAAWGVTVTSDLSGLFASSYNVEDDDYSGEGTVSVNSSTGKLLLAPGTSGSAASASVITGTPEVAVRVATTATVTMTGDWEDENGAFYCPVVFTINGDEFSSLEGHGEYTSAETMKTAMENKIKAATADFAPNTDLSGESIDVAISWTWAFVGADADDTALGDAAAGVDGAELPEIQIDFQQTVTQIN